MWFLTIGLVFLAASQTTATAPCDACLSNKCYKKISVLERYQQIGQLDIDRKDNILYFHVRNSKSEFFTIAFDLDNVDMKRIWDVDFSFARAVDQKTRDVYLSTESSVFKVNPNQNYTNGETVFEKTVWHLFFKDKLYYVEYGVKGVQIFENNAHTKINALSAYQVDDLVVDKNNDIYFVADFAVYKLENGTTDVKLFADDIYVLSTDKDGEVYFVQPYEKAFYKLDYGQKKMVELGAISVGTPHKFVFTDANYIIYNDMEMNIIFYLVPSQGSCSISQSGDGKNKRKGVSVNV